MQGSSPTSAYSCAATPEIPCDEAEAIAREASDLLNKHAVGGMAVSLVSSSLLALVLSRSVPIAGLFAWWLLMLTTLTMRSVFLIRWNRQRKRSAPRNAQREITEFIRGISTTGFCWTIFPLLFFHHLDLAGRATLSTLLCGLAAGSAIILSAKEGLSIAFCAALLLPVSLQLLASGSPDSAVIGSLGVIFFLVTVHSARLSHRAMLRSVRLGRANDALLDGMKARSEELLREVLAKEQYAGEVIHLASHDALTGLYNRAELSERLEAALTAADCRNGCVAVLFIDLDKFKEVNDVHGHFAGDQVLKTVTRRLQSRLGPNADLARWGGDEFVVVLRNLTSHALTSHAGAEALALALANGLCECLEEPIDLEPEAVKIGATIGIALYPEHGPTQDALIRAADLAMYQGKQDRSASRIRLFDHALAEDLSRRYRFTQSLGRAVAENALSVLFQPIVLVPEGRCVALEALVRWTHHDLGLIPPSEFIPQAERSGDIVAIGRWVLNEACQIAVTWPSQPGHDPPAVSVNVSTAQVFAGCLVNDVTEAMRRSGLPARRLHIELTESLFAGNQELVGPTLQALRAMGVRISLDDFGTGFSSLAYLRTLPVDTIKIDKSFVDDIEGESRSIVTAIVSISKAMDFELIAEGVETERQMAILMSMGVVAHQGYLLARPLRPDDIPPWLSTLHFQKECAFSGDGTGTGADMSALAVAIHAHRNATPVLPSTRPKRQAPKRIM